MSILANASAHAVAAVSAVVPADQQVIMTNWSPSPELQQWGKWIAAALLLFWVAYIFTKLVTPKKGATRQINWLGFGLSGVVSMILLNLNVLPNIINNVATLFVGLLKMIGIG